MKLFVQATTRDIWMRALFPMVYRQRLPACICGGVSKARYLLCYFFDEGEEPCV